jgi:hypothetical protein
MYLIVRRVYIVDIVLGFEERVFDVSNSASSV